MDNSIKKNILDLHFQKALVTASTAIILLFTYLIAIALGFITGQITLEGSSLLLLLGLSSPIILFFSFFFFYSIRHIKSIPAVLKGLEK